MNCDFCGKECPTNKSYIAHRTFCRSNPNRKLPSYGMTGKKGIIERGDVKISEEGMARIVAAARNRKQSEATKRKLSEIAKSRGLGGHTSKNSLRYVKVDGSEVFLQSGFEVKVAEQLDQYGVAWERPKPLDWVDEEGGTHKYYPDFLLTEYGIFLDPKNDYLMLKDKPKIDAVMKQNQVLVLMLNEDQLTWEAIKQVAQIG